MRSQQLKRKFTSLTAVTFSSEYSSFLVQFKVFHMKSSDAKASKCHLKFSSKMIIFY